MAIAFEEKCDYCGIEMDKGITRYENDLSDAHRACDDLKDCKERMREQAVEDYRAAADVAAAVFGPGYVGHPQ